MKLIGVITTSIIELSKEQFDRLRNMVRSTGTKYHLTQGGVEFFYKAQEYFSLCSGPTLTRRGFDIEVIEEESIRISEIIPDMGTHKQVRFTKAH